MASTSTVSVQSGPAATTPRSIILYLRLEGLAIAAVSAALYARTGASWWLFAALWLVPDLSMLGYLGGSCRGARVYNAFHSYVLPGALALSALLLRAHGLLPIALIWVNHIGVDRLLGYGLKYADGFKWTHLGRLGKGEATSPSGDSQVRPA
jgi:Domain of unknown function (DUF4260)